MGQKEQAFERMKQSRNMPWLLIGMRVEVDGKPGKVVGSNSSSNLDVIFDGQRHKNNCHPGWKTKYFLGDKVIAEDGRLIP
jgi:hypothetical protein